MEDKLNIDRLTADAVELLREMIAIPSPSFEETAVCSHISDWLNARDIEHKRIGNNIVAEHITDPTGPALMLCAHIDTVSPSPNTVLILTSLRTARKIWFKVWEVMMTEHL